MPRPLSPHLVVSLGVLGLAACGGGESPTQPDSPTEPTPAGPQNALTSNTWILKKAYPAVFGAVGLSAGVVPNASGQSIVYTFGGTDNEGGSGVSIFTYNVATNVWASQGFEPRVYAFNTNGVGRIGTRLYFSGGYSFGGGSFSTDGRFWMYDPAANSLTEKPFPPKSTADGVTGVIDGKLYVLPGTCSTDFYPNPVYCDHEAFRRLFRYNPNTNLWATKKPAPHYHRKGAGGAISGKFYVAGGIDDLQKNVAALDRYDPTTDTWQTLAPLPIAGRARGAVLQGKLFVIVARERADFSTELRAYLYDPATNTWTPKAAPRREHPDVVQVTFSGTPHLFAVGGVHEDPTVTPSTVVNASELYTP